MPRRQRGGCGAGVGAREGSVFNQSVQGISNAVGMANPACVPKLRRFFHYDDIALLLDV